MIVLSQANDAHRLQCQWIREAPSYGVLVRRRRLDVALIDVYQYVGATSP